LQLTEAEQKSIEAKKTGFLGWPKEAKTQTPKPASNNLELQVEKP